MSKKMSILQNYLQKNRIEACCDEAGRGCLAGPVFAAAVILPPEFDCPELNDSKKLSEKMRYKLRPIIEKEALAFAVASVSAEEIDQINILNASILGMHRALQLLKIKPEHILVDGNRFKPFQEILHTCIIKGDSKFMSIAAASVLAKTYRDDYMNGIATDFPQYDWLSNKGYPTAKHRRAIAEFGITPHHRKTFRLLDNQLKIEI